MSKVNESWGRFAAKAAMLGAVVLVAAFVGVRLANAGPGEPVRKALTVSGTLTGPMVGSNPRATFRFYRAMGDTTPLCAPQVTIRDGMDRNTATGAFSVEVPLDQSGAGRTCPETLFHDPNAYVEVAIEGTAFVTTRAAINPVPYAVYAQQYGTPDCPVGWERVTDTFFSPESDKRLCIRRRASDRGMVEEIVRVGSGPSTFWIDRFEASVMGTLDGVGPRFGTTSDDYGTAFPDNGIWGEKRYAISVQLPAGAGNEPARYITWFQANTACRLAGKRLPTGDEWLMAAIGTRETGTDCHVGADRARAAGQSNTCRSYWGAHDMFGNLQEWTTEWFAGLGTPPTMGPLTTFRWPDGYGAGSTYNIASGARSGDAMRTAGLPAAAARGGAWPGGDGVFTLNLAESPAFSAMSIGFRCVIPR